MSKYGKEFLLTAKLYKSANHAYFLAPEKRKLEDKAALQTEGTSANKQKNKTTKNIVKRKFTLIRSR